MTAVAPGVTHDTSIWAYVALKDGAFSGAITADAPRASIINFFDDALLSGCEVLSVSTREEYLAMLTSCAEEAK